ncbi:hypothetical protein GGR56DRAFT_616253, partial [Xylariaceae sp. FL0804]
MSSLNVGGVIGAWYGVIVWLVLFRGFVPTYEALESRRKDTYLLVSEGSLVYVPVRRAGMLILTPILTLAHFPPPVLLNSPNSREGFPADGGRVLPRDSVGTVRPKNGRYRKQLETAFVGYAGGSCIFPFHFFVNG